MSWSTSEQNDSRPALPGWQTGPVTPAPAPARVSWMARRGVRVESVGASEAEALAVPNADAATFVVDRAAAAALAGLLAAAGSANTVAASVRERRAAIAAALSTGAVGARALAAALARIENTDRAMAATVGKLAASAATGTSVAGMVTPPVTPPQLTEFAAVGSFTYSIPWWCNYIDAVGIGGGHGGYGGNWTLSNGGAAGTWAGRTLVRGTDFPATASTLTVVVGDGGFGGAAGGHGGNGANSTVAGPNTQTLVAAGSTAYASGWDGTPAGSFTFNGQTYVGGNAAGAAPGSGGNGAGNVFSAGQGGGRGKVWLRAYQ